jgi:hypothetical protein
MVVVGDFGTKLISLQKNRFKSKTIDLNQKNQSF